MSDEFKVNEAFDLVVRYLNGDFPYCPELIAFWMSVQGAMTIRNGPNKEGKMHWFHAFVLSSLTAFAGGTFNPIWMGSPSGILGNDVFMACCITSFVLVNYSPGDIGYMSLNTLPLSIVTVAFAQLFRSLGTIKFLTTCFNHFKDSPSPYYPIPVFGPIIYGILLGNMGPLVLKGLTAHIENGIPFPIQNGLFVAPFYHFYVHDNEGPIGNLLRNTMPIAKMFDMDDKTFAYCVVSGFMQVVGILQMPAFLGPSFNPFTMRFSFSFPSDKEEPPAKVTTRSIRDSDDHGEGQQTAPSKAKKTKKKKKKTS